MGSHAIVRPSSLKPHSVSRLATQLGLEHHGPEGTVTGISLHTDLVAPGDLFVAIAGAKRHGAEFWQDAKNAGAVALLTDPEGWALLEGSDVPVVVAASPRDYLGSVASEIYGTHEGTLPLMLGVTGTNGKTSTTFLLDALMRALGWTTALSTTAQRRVGDQTFASTLTTPEAPDTHALVALAKEQGVQGIALEVSAQALDKNRLDGVVFDVAGFTNLSHDHFEDFDGMERYLEAKAVLFTPKHARSAVICVDTTWGQKLYDACPIPATTIAQESGPTAHWSYAVVDARGDSTVFRVTSSEGSSIEVWGPIIGTHMVSNAALAIAMLVSGGVSLEDIGAAVGLDTPGIPVQLPGRLERVSGPTGPQVFVDAGHSEDAYRATLAAVRARTTGTLVMVCGTSGNRDPSKRPIMGAVAAELADVVIVTDTSPRGEDPAQVRRGLLEGARSVQGAIVHEVSDPAEAIRQAVSLVSEGDAVLWMGQGSQAYRDLGPEKIPFSAVNEARAALRASGWMTDQEPRV